MRGASTGLVHSEETLRARLHDLRKQDQPLLLVLTHADEVYGDGGAAMQKVLPAQVESVLSSLASTVPKLKIIATMSSARSMGGLQAGKCRIGGACIIAAEAFQA